MSEINQTRPEAEYTPVLVITDDGRDVDDVQALAYLNGSDRTEVVGIIATHMIPDRRALIARAFMSHLGQPDVPIGVGSIFPIGKEDDALVRYLREHSIQGRTYEGDGLIECFPDAEKVALNAIRKYGKDLRVAAFAPLTDLAKVALNYPDDFSSIGGIYIQGQARVENGLLVPDEQAYNLQQDMEAAKHVFQRQGDVSLTLVGKFAAYALPLTRDDFENFGGTGNPAGAYLRTHAIKGIQCFAERAPEVFRRVFGVSPDQLGTLDELSKPYDALVAMAISDPDHFLPIQIGSHSLIGMTQGNPGVVNPTDAKDKLIGTIMDALSRP